MFLILDASFWTKSSFWNSKNNPNLPKHSITKADLPGSLLWINVPQMTALSAQSSQPNLHGTTQAHLHLLRQAGHYFFCSHLLSLNLHEAFSFVCFSLNIYSNSHLRHLCQSWWKPMISRLFRKGETKLTCTQLFACALLPKVTELKRKCHLCSLIRTLQLFQEDWYELHWCFLPEEWNWSQRSFWQRHQLKQWEHSRQMITRQTSNPGCWAVFPHMQQGFKLATQRTH